MPPKPKKPPQSKSASSRQANVKRKISEISLEKPLKEKLSCFVNKNVVQCLDYFQHGRLRPQEIRRVGEILISEKLKNFYHYRTDPINFERRITALKFHPSSPYTLGIGDKSGEFVIRFLETDYRKEDCVSWDGIGPGGSITDIAFDPFTPDSVFTTSIDGTVQIRNYSLKTSKELLNTGSFELWYCSVNASEDVGLVMAGDTTGGLKVMNKDLKVIAYHKIHKRKLNSIDFCMNRGWLFATASLDSTVKLWDVRKIDEESPLEILNHTNPLNAAYFSSTNGNRLLTSDQYSELRVYKCPLFKLETKIFHPHRQFQHLTPIKATWHPLTDLIVVGRYPDPKWPDYVMGELNTIDVISPTTGETLTQLSSASAKGIVSLNSFSCSGETLASGMGVNVLYRRHRQPKSLSDLSNGPSGRNNPDDDDPDDLPPPGPSKKKPPRKTKNEKCPKSKTSKLKGK